VSVKDPADLIRQEVALVESGVELQSQGLALLLAEMQALAGMISASAVPYETKSDAETEADFDNMPV
jgi:hypothetical protein